MQVTYSHVISLCTLTNDSALKWLNIFRSLFGAFSHFKQYFCYIFEIGKKISFNMCCAHVAQQARVEDFLTSQLNKSFEAYRVSTNNKSAEGISHSGIS